MTMSTAGNIASERTPIFVFRFFPTLPFGLLVTNTVYYNNSSLESAISFLRLYIKIDAQRVQSCHLSGQLFCITCLLNWHTSKLMTA